MTTSKLQSMLVAAAREIEDNKYWMNRAYKNYMEGKLEISVSASVGFSQYGMKGAFTGAVPPDFREELSDAKKELDRLTSEARRVTINPANYIPVKNAAYKKAYAFYYEGGWKESSEYQFIENHKFIPYARSATPFPQSPKPITTTSKPAIKRSVALTTPSIAL